MFKWILKKLIKWERNKQIFFYGYTPEHDDHELKANPYHLLDEAQRHYNWGHPIQALALMEAQKEYGQRLYEKMIASDPERRFPRLSEDK